jgi:hypothetical protein
MTGQVLNDQVVRRGVPPPRHVPPVSRPGGFSRGYAWLILRNVLGWVLIVDGALIPGPVGLPVFMIAFALISFPGKRRPTARALRGKAVQFPEFLLTDEILKFCKKGNQRA